MHPKRWQIMPAAPPSHIARFPHMHAITVQVCYNRGLTDPADVAAFLGDQQDEANPFGLKGVQPAVTRLRQALRTGERIAIYGDFDVDGITATALLVQTLRALGGDASHYIPHRVDEGYGLNKQALTQLARAGARVVVTVDCGVRSVDEVDYANRLGLDVILTDHHSVGPELPEAVAVIDPKQADDRYPFVELAAVGVAYRLAQALLRSHRQIPVTSQEVRLEEKDLLDLVALGTVADLVPLRGENRALVHLGLARANAMERPGIEALCRVARLQSGQVNSTAIGYALGPRLNAAGRLGCADTAYDLLMTQYPAEAERLAGQLDRLNRERQRLTRELQDRARAVALSEIRDFPLIFVADSEFPVGVVGLVAGRLAEEFYRPAVVVQVGDEVSRGSARSIAEFHITEALDECEELMIRHGGHAGAAGFTVANKNLDELVARLRRIAADQLADVELTPVLAVDAEVELAQISWELQQELAGLEPYGYENPEPLFLSRDVRVQDHRAVGAEGRHLKLVLVNNGIIWDGIAFRQGEWAGKLPNRVDIVYRIEVNEWNGRKRLQLNVRDIRPAALDHGLAGRGLDEERPQVREDFGK